VLLVGDDLSLEINRVVSGLRVSCAVAFWGRGSDDIFGRPDLSHVRIVCNLRMGGTNPLAILALQSRGALVQHLDNLHAKVYIGDVDTVVASANASKNGLGINSDAGAVLLEAGVVVPSTSAISWFDRLWQTSHVVKPSDITAALVAYSKRQNTDQQGDADKPAEFGASLLKMSMRRASSAILQRSRVPMTAVQIAAILINAGFKTASTPHRAVYESLRTGLRSEFMHLERGLWALSSWPEYAGYTLTEAEAARLDRVRGPRQETDLVLSERVKAGLLEAKKRGVKQGAVIKVTPDRLQQIQNMFKSGMVYPKIALEMGLSEPTIKRALKKSGLRRNRLTT